MVMEKSTVERILAHDRIIVVTCLGLCVALSAWYIFNGAGMDMSAVGMSVETGLGGALIAGTPDMVGPDIWPLRYALVVFIMWCLMMVAMMVPSAAPTILLYGALNREKGARSRFEFLFGYLAIWAGFSLAATLLQGALAAAGMISSMYMTLTNTYLASAVLIVAGFYQFSPLKAACLSHCRGPVEALTRHRRTGRLAAFRMGLVNGRFCLGCCWALMALLFVGGVMNIWWIAGITLYVAAEKLAPGGRQIAKGLGALLLTAGFTLLAKSAGVF
jgi:predicted metal-binding membrane protein